MHLQRFLFWPKWNPDTSRKRIKQVSFLVYFLSLKVVSGTVCCRIFVKIANTAKCGEIHPPTKHAITPKISRILPINCQNSYSLAWNCASARKKLEPRSYFRSGVMSGQSQKSGEISGLFTKNTVFDHYLPILWAFWSLFRLLGILYTTVCLKRL